jgi:hypothetical protein
MNRITLVNRAMYSSFTFEVRKTFEYTDEKVKAALWVLFTVRFSYFKHFWNKTKSPHNIYLFFNVFLCHSYCTFLAGNGADNSAPLITPGEIQIWERSRPMNQSQKLEFNAVCIVRVRDLFHFLSQSEIIFASSPLFTEFAHTEVVRLPFALSVCGTLNEILSS